MADVFISYAKAQRALTESLAKDLEAAGLSTWWDTGLRPGENFRNKIDDQLNACKAAVIIWTPEAVKSDWVISEADHAWQQKKLVNTHVPEIKPYQIPKPFNQSHSAEVANRAVIIDAIRTRIAQHTLVGEPGLDASASELAPDPRGTNGRWPWARWVPPLELRSWGRAGRGRPGHVGWLVLSRHRSPPGPPDSTPKVGL